MLSGKSILVTGGTGSFGKMFVGTVLSRYPDVSRLVVYSRDEHKQFEMRQSFSETEYPMMRYVIGDVRDKERLTRACEEIDIIIHAAAFNQMEAAELNPFEAIKTNILGAQNVIEAAMDQDVQQVVALSTDKAAGPDNLCDATRLCSDKLFVAANDYLENSDLSFSVARYGDVMGSRGTIVPFFTRKRVEGVLPIADTAMTRFNTTLEQSVKLALTALHQMWGGEIFVPKTASYLITDMAQAIGPQCRQIVIGLKTGEKLHEELITAAESSNTLEFDNHFAIMPTRQLWDVNQYMLLNNGRRCQPGKAYNSGTNPDRLTVDQLRELIRDYCDHTLDIEPPKGARLINQRVSIDTMRFDLDQILTEA